MLIVLWITCARLALGLEGPGRLEALPVVERLPSDRAAVDWLLDGSSFEARVVRTGRPHEIALDNGLIRRTFTLAPDAATVGLDLLVTGKALLRAVRPEALVTIDGASYRIGGLRGQPNHAFLTEAWRAGLESGSEGFRYVGFEVGAPAARLDWARVRHAAPCVAWPPRGVALRLDFESAEPGSALRVSVHYELYSGIPCLSKWITVHNGSTRSITVDRFTSEVLAAVEHGSAVEYRGVPLPPPDIHVETDFAFGGMTHGNANRHAVHWVPDPEYATQVNYLRKTPCLLEVRPTFGPSVDLAPGGTFESFRTFLLPHDSSDRERRGLAVRRMYRTIAPWVTENPLMMHVRWSDEKTVKAAIDQCAEVGFEMVILTFGSGFNIEDESEDYLTKMRGYADYAREREVEIGGYSLLSSRRIGGGHDVVSPEGEKPTHGNCPALTSEWGLDYLGKLDRFFERTGFRLLEHDGSYPGDRDVTARPPRQKGELDSRWVQWSLIRDFYRRCRARGIYLNVPDYYYLAGSSKCGMGYRETNWSLPRDQQVLHTRQNIYDGTWEKTPSMGWMFVPLTEYHGGGAAATIEPLDEHRDHYERMLSSNLGLGVQACYRGPRLFDTDRTRDLVRQWVGWFKSHRNILESDVVHGRRPDGRDVDWMLHVNPGLDEKGMLVVFNPLDRGVERTLTVDLYYTGLTGRARVRREEGEAVVIPVRPRGQAEIPVRVPARGMTWLVISE